MAIMLPNLTKIGILIDFKINQDFIAKVLCINKDEPVTTCNGKCYLSKQLKKAEEQEKKQAPSDKEERVEIVYYYLKSSLDEITFSNCYSVKHNPGYGNEFYHFSLIADIYHPPEFNLI
ncbi:MAG: hypothetical protein KJO53_03455 [Eudoraea sp.]|nr:hypothetical protein [Eudoraea sp.]MBT8394702.1 hypothetical protein [Bacteroidia bacterium]NNL01668.1 hypothetical protein [Eudoraea sp.]